MVRDQADETEDVHVFDQTNGIVDLEGDDSTQTKTDDDMTDADRRRVVGGIAMLSANRPNG
ncbi:hypothetical protein [Amnibacterium kyonggiense]|uniref:Uncharacterized protein n=1 Tax=Amnibacterium kyonggiense TaxID=595671 RepID=A0A4R7FGJ0_9MICO|nr:hypothetical protein [Amnibacterium kyonggiense]TDS75805.1 hypothetical protein CLV52_2914 [Amnibacterium kyonggiense]